MAIERRIEAGVSVRRILVRTAASSVVGLWKRLRGTGRREARAIGLAYEGRARERRTRVTLASAQEEETLQRARHFSSAVRDSPEPLTFEDFMGMVGGPGRLRGDSSRTPREGGGKEGDDGTDEA